MNELYFVMRGVARVVTFVAVFWSVGWGLDQLTGGAISADINTGVNFRGEVELFQFFAGLGVALGAAVVLYFLWRVGGGDPGDTGDV